MRFDVPGRRPSSCSASRVCFVVRRPRRLLRRDDEPREVLDAVRRPPAARRSAAGWRWPASAARPRGTSPARRPGGRDSSTYLTAARAAGVGRTRRPAARTAVPAAPATTPTASFCDSCGTVACLSAVRIERVAFTATRTRCAWSTRSRRSTSAATAARTRPRSSRRCSTRRAALLRRRTSTTCRWRPAPGGARGRRGVRRPPPPPRSSGCTSPRPAAGGAWPGGCSPTSRRRRTPRGREAMVLETGIAPARGDRALRVVRLRPRPRVRLLPRLAALPLPGDRAADHP